ncbi:hypothetical protein CDAR_407161 [Caerostris darwini]|uniref:Uncharacterized protein n=1 Tax=Caerostris darwini TaxID=1538125 RepID=A0AAV4Q1A5_9ARAC|nr:hypothetical protein CDAR_407161 [Caerostris darwini]
MATSPWKKGLNNLHGHISRANEIHLLHFIGFLSRRPFGEGGNGPHGHRYDISRGGTTSRQVHLCCHSRTFKGCFPNSINAKAKCNRHRTPFQ